ICAAALTICGATLASAADIVNVHFSTPVMVGETTLPAGDVSIQILRGSNSAILTARSESGAAVAVVVNRLNGLDDKEAHTSVILGRHGNALKLERIWLDDHTGFAVLPNAE